MAEFNSELYEVGSRIRERRIELNMTQTKLALLAGITAASLSYIENGQKEAKLNTLIEIEKALKVSLDYFQPSDLDQYAAIPKELEALLPKLKSKSPVERKKLIQMFSSMIDIM